MAIKTTPRKIGEGLAAINALLATKLPVKAAYSVGKLAGAAQSEWDRYQAARDKIFENSGCTVSPDKKRWEHADPAVLQASSKEAEELGSVEVELAGTLPLDLEQFGAADVPGHAFLYLDWAMKADAA